MKPIYMTYGGGINSTAIAVEFMNRGIAPEDIVFADTGGEKPETYQYVELFSSWLVDRGFPAITVVRRAATDRAPYRTLEEECLHSSTLPSIAYGFKRCSDKWKLRPQHTYAKQKYGDGIADLLWVIGYDAGETRRVENALTKKHPYEVWYPLYEWGWDRSKCVEVIKKAGLPLPPKSSCFFCPSMKKPEISALMTENPELFTRAIAIEDAAMPNLDTVKGLGRRFSWRELSMSESQDTTPAYDYETDIPCGCFDEGEE